MQKKLEIKPKVGFGDLKFGATTKEVEQYFGVPQETEKLDIEGEEEDVEVWSYWDQGHSVYFEKEHKEVCTNIETDNEAAELFGEKVFKLDEPRIIELMQSNGFADFEVEEEEPGEKIVFFHDAHLQFVFEEDSLVLVSWAVGVDDDEKILWP
jgi:hypothetical protein